MYKKSKYKRIGFGTTYKKRYFCITTQHFFYAKAKNKTPLFKLPISEISVNKLQNGFHSKNVSHWQEPVVHTNLWVIISMFILQMFQVVHKMCTLHIQAGNCVQEKEWLDTLSRMIELNVTQNSTEKVQPLLGANDGCNYMITPDLSIKLDPDRELERVHCLFVSNQVNMQTIMEACEKGLNSVKIWKGYGKTHASQFVIEDESSLMQTLGKLRECVTLLEKYHQSYLESIHGTQSAPLEVDNSYCNGNSIWQVPNDRTSTQLLISTLSDLASQN